MESPIELENSESKELLQNYLVSQQIRFRLRKNKDETCEAFQKRSATILLIEIPGTEASCLQSPFAYEALLLSRTLKG